MLPRDAGQPRQDAQDVVGEEGEQEGQGEEDGGLGLQHRLVLLRQLPAHQPVGEVPAQPPGQGEHQQGARRHGGVGEEEGGPGPKEQPAGHRGDVAGDGGQHHRQELDHEQPQVGVGGEPGDIGPQPLHRGGALKKTGVI